MKNDDDLRPFKMMGLPIIPFMTLIAIFGIILTFLLQYFFPHLA